MIPPEAVEAAAIAWVGEQVWQDCNEAWRADYLERAQVFLEAAAPYMLAGLRADLVKLAKDFDTAEGGTLAYLSQNGLRKNAHDQLMYVIDDHLMLNTEGEK